MGAQCGHSTNIVDVGRWLKHTPKEKERVHEKWEAAEQLTTRCGV